jgi:hypothetical protein
MSMSLDTTPACAYAHVLPYRAGDHGGTTSPWRYLSSPTVFMLARARPSAGDETVDSRHSLGASTRPTGITPSEEAGLEPTDLYVERLLSSRAITLPKARAGERGPSSDAQKGQLAEVTGVMIGSDKARFRSPWSCSEDESL